MLEMLPELYGLARGGVGGWEEGVQQTAWASLAVLVEGLGGRYPQKFLPVYEVLGEVVEGGGGGGGERGGGKPPSSSSRGGGGGGGGGDRGGGVNSQVLSSALLCAASTTHALGPLSLPHLPTFLPLLLPLLSPPPHPPTHPPTPHDAALLCVSSLLTTLPTFLSPFLPSLLTTLLSSSSSSSSSSTLSLLAQSIPPRLLLPVLFSSYSPTHPPTPSHLLRLLCVLGEVIDVNGRKELIGGGWVGGLGELTSFFLDLMDYRSVGEKGGWEEVEKEVGEVLVRLVLKLNEEELRVLFVRLGAWKKEGEGGGVGGRRRRRRVVFYRVLDRLVGTLKVSAVGGWVGGWVGWWVGGWLWVDEKYMAVMSGWVGVWVGGWVGG